MTPELLMAVARAHAACLDLLKLIGDEEGARETFALGVTHGWLFLDFESQGIFMAEKAGHFIHAPNREMLLESIQICDATIAAPVRLPGLQVDLSKPSASVPANAGLEGQLDEAQRSSMGIPPAPTSPKPHSPR